MEPIWAALFSNVMNRQSERQRQLRQDPLDRPEWQELFAIVRFCQRVSKQLVHRRLQLHKARQAAAKSLENRGGNAGDRARLKWLLATNRKCRS